MRRQRYNTIATDNTNNTNNNSSSEEDDDDDNGNPIDDDTDDVEQPAVSPRQRRLARTAYARIAASASAPSTAVTTVDLEAEEVPLAAAIATLTPTTAPEDEEDGLTVIILDYTHKRWTVTVPTNRRRSNNNSTGSSSSSNNNNNNHPHPLTVRDLKVAGAAVHQIAVDQQRLIYRGALLNDATLLSTAGIVAPNTLVHLFPKPRVIVVNNNNTNSNNTTNASNISHDPSFGSTPTPTDSATTNEGARVPTIVLDQAEADRRGDILVLSSMDYMEAVNNVKLFSFMLLIVSSMELLSLLAIFLGDGAPPLQQTTQSAYSTGSSSSPPNSNALDPYDALTPFSMHDDFFPDDDDKDNKNNAADDAYDSSHTPNESNNHPSIHNNNSNHTLNGDTTSGALDPVYMLLEQWTPLKYVDVLLSLLGIYVALLGIRASNENCIQTARRYWIGTAVVALLWLAYNYTFSLHYDEAVQDELEQGLHTPYTEQFETMSGGGDGGSLVMDVYNMALEAMILPALVWGLCIFRAWHFHHLLAEAEAEAAARIAAEHHHSPTTSVNDDDSATRTTTRRTDVNDDQQDIELTTLASRLGTVTRHPYSLPVTNAVAT